MKNSLRKKVRMPQFIKTGVLGLVIAIMASSCVKNYTFQKVVVNNSKHDVEVRYGCCENEIVTMVPALEEKIIFECGYQSVNPPSCDDVNGKCTTDAPTTIVSQDIGNSDNWFTETNGKTVKCVFTINPSHK